VRSIFGFSAFPSTCDATSNADPILADFALFDA